MSYERTVKVHFHGYLKELCPEPIEASGYSVFEILNGVSNQTEALRPALGEGRHHITVKGYEDQNKLTGPIDHKETELHIFPALTGGKKGGFIKIVIGVALIATALMLGPTWTALGGWLTSSGIMSFGVSMVLGGLLEVMSPAPKIDKTGNSVSDPEASKYLGANGNTTKVGTRIALAYGENLMFGQYLSFNVDAKDVAL